MLMKLMFPPRPADCKGLLEEFDDQLPAPPVITEAQIRQHIACLHPHKAPGTDEIPNIVLKKSVELISPYLLQIFRAVLRLQVYSAQWKDIITCILRKPRYDVPKAYCPIMLVNTISKLLSSIVAEDISHLVETHQLLPSTHFRGRPGQSTMDSIGGGSHALTTTSDCENTLLLCFLLLTLTPTHCYVLCRSTWARGSGWVGSGSGFGLGWVRLGVWVGLGQARGSGWVGSGSGFIQTGLQ